LKAGFLNQGARNHEATRAPAWQGTRVVPHFALSFIRTVTVGFGIAPNLLTLVPVEGTRRSRARAASLSRKAAITAGGELHPALRTLAVRLAGRRRDS